MSRVMQPEQSVTFDVLAEIAAGTTARIDLCRVRQPVDKAGMLVAVKRLHKHIAEDPQFADMFFDEVWMTAALHHQNVVDVVGWGTDREGTFLAVELVQGVSLARLMKTVFETGEMFSERMVVFLGSAICAGLSAAHQLRDGNGELLNLVHRDLTPGNVLISFNGHIKITDFGLAKAKQRVTKTLTGLLKGHPQYMAPEMARGFEIDSRADLFSLGVVLFELFTGQHPWSGGTELEIMRVTATDPPRDVLSLRPKLDKELANIVSGLLEKDPTRRFQTADEVQRRLWSWLDAHGYSENNDEALGRFVRRNAMRQMRWFERAVAGELQPSPLSASPESLRVRSRNLARDKSKPPPAGKRRNRRSADDLGDSFGEDGGPDTSDETDVERDAGVRSLADTRPERDPRPTRPMPAANAATAEGIDWGEEIPTVVQKKDPTSKAQPPGAAANARAADARLPKFAIADDDSDQRTTSVKSKFGITGKGSSMGVPTMLDMESDEVPTVPIAGTRKDALEKALAGIAPRKARDTGAVIHKLPPPPPPVKAGVRDAARGSQRPIPPLPPPPGTESRPPRDPARDAPRATAVPQDSFLAQADRMAVDAVRLREEAELASRVAAHKSRLAKLANEAASLAAEAARAASQGSSTRAAGLMREAGLLEDLVLRDAAIPDDQLPQAPPEPGPGFAAPARAHESPPPANAPAFAGAAAGLTTAHASIGGALPQPPSHDASDRISAPPPPPSPPLFPSSPPMAALSVPPPRAPTFPSNPPPGQIFAGAISPEYQSNSRIRPTVVPNRASAWEAFYRREVLGFPAPVALVLAAVLLTSVIAAIAMLVR